MRTYTIELTEQQLTVIGNLLGEAPFKVAAPIVGAINRQVSMQASGNGKQPDLEPAEAVE